VDAAAVRRTSTPDEEQARRGIPAHQPRVVAIGFVHHQLGVAIGDHEHDIVVSSRAQARRQTWRCVRRAMPPPIAQDAAKNLDRL
jgi:hypothetical protein